MQEAYKRKQRQGVLTSSGRTGVVVLYESAHCALYWFQVWSASADRPCLVTKQIEINENCDEVPFDCCYFLSAWRDQQKI